MDFSCEMGVDCAEFPCGGASWFDEDGCRRAFCMTDDECVDGEVCYQDYDCDPEGCHHGYVGCAPCLDDESSCCCGAVGGCGRGPGPRGWCIPAEDKPC